MANRLKPLQGMVVIDRGVGMAAALVVKFLTELGARVITVEPDGGDPFAELYPAYEIWKGAAEKSGQAASSSDELEKLLSGADICIVGGEDHPTLTRQSDAGDISSCHPHVIVLEIEGYPQAHPDAGRPAVDILLQARAGLVWELYSARPTPITFSPSAYGAAMRALIGILAAVYERIGSGRGQLVSTSLYEGVVNCMAGLWSSAEKAKTLSVPLDPQSLIFRTADGHYVQTAIAATGAKQKIYKALGIDDSAVDPADSGLPTQKTSAKNFFGDYDLLAKYITKMTLDDVLQRIWEVGQPAEAILPPGGCWGNPQIEYNQTLTTSADGTRYVGNPIISSGSGKKGRVGCSPQSRPLDDVRVLDFGDFVAGPYASIGLAELGAEVIKIEPIAGDKFRSNFLWYHGTNRGKRAISLDLKAEEGRRIVHQLCAASDVVSSNFRPGATGRLGIDAKTLHDIKPELVVLEAPAYGTGGPLKMRAGFDVVFQAWCGHEYRAGGKGNTPASSRTTMVDYTNGLLGTIAMLCGLVYRARTGEGSFLATPLLSAGLFISSDTMQKPDGSWIGVEPLNSSQTGFTPAECLYQTADEWVAIAIRDRKSGRALAEMLGLQNVLGDAFQHWSDAEHEGIARALETFSTEDAMAGFERSGIWAEVCRKDMQEQILNDPLSEELGIIDVADHPEYGKIRRIGTLIRFSRSEVAHGRLAPATGDATDDLMEKCGYSKANVDALKEAKIVA